MNCRTCKFFKQDQCIKDCLQIHFKYDPSETNRYPVKVHKSEIACVEITSRFLSVTDIDGTQHCYNFDTITHFHIPDLRKK